VRGGGGSWAWPFRAGRTPLNVYQMSTDAPVLAWRRPLCAAVAAAGRGRFVLDGVARMRERPIADLVDGLRQLGVDAECTAGTGCPPVTVIAAGLPSGTVRRRQLCVPCGWICCRHRLPAGDRQRRRPTLRHGETAVSSWAAAQLAQSMSSSLSFGCRIGMRWPPGRQLRCAPVERTPCSGALPIIKTQVRLSGSVSSQYLTALLMAAPLATGDGGVEIIITDELVSQPYVDMTVRLMERFGVKVRRVYVRQRKSQETWWLRPEALQSVAYASASISIALCC